MKWAFELSQIDVKYKARSAFKGQVMADFVAEQFDTTIESRESPTWVLKIDDLSRKHKGGAGIVLKTPMTYS